MRAAGDPDRVISTVAVCGGAGDSFLPAAADAGVDVYLTSDLRHHVVAEFVADPANPAVVDVAHWAGEWPWLANAAAADPIGTSGADGHGVGHPNRSVDTSGRTSTGRLTVRGEPAVR